MKQKFNIHNRHIIIKILVTKNSYFIHIQPTTKLYVFLDEFLNYC